MKVHLSVTLHILARDKQVSEPNKIVPSRTVRSIMKMVDLTLYE